GGIFNLNGNNQTVGALSGSGGTIALGASALTVNETGNTSYAGTISGSGHLALNGSGTLALSGSNTYTGGTTVNRGTLSISSNSRDRDRKSTRLNSSHVAISYAVF